MSFLYVFLQHLQKCKVLISPSSSVVIIYLAKGVGQLCVISRGRISDVETDHLPH